MKSFVITIRDLEESQQCADRCIKSAKNHNLVVEKFFGITPKDGPVNIAKEEGIPTSSFVERYSRFENCLSAFLSHYSLWKMCAEGNEDYMIFEHDAVVQNFIKEDVYFVGVLSYGAPSYGKFDIPPLLGVNKLTSKQYLPGAHAYRIKPQAARSLLRAAKENACPTDLFLSNKNFSFIQEFYPWPVYVNDSFSTIQNETGCMAKHNYGNTFRVI